jgi:putative transposase
MSRDDYPSGKLACVSLQALEEMLAKFLIDIYAQSHHRGLGDIPARRWEEALSNGFMPRVPQNAEDLLILLGRIEHRTIFHYGIDLNRIRYNSAELAPIRTMIKKHPERFGRKVKLKYHPSNLRRIHVFDPFNDRYIEVPALDQEYTQDLSLWKHKVIQRYARLIGYDEDLAALGRAKQEIRNIVDEQKSVKKQASRARTARYEDAGKSPSLKTDQTASPPTGVEIDDARRTLKVKDSQRNSAGRKSVDSLDEPLDEGWSIKTKVVPDGSDNLRQDKEEDNDQ